MTKLSVPDFRHFRATIDHVLAARDKHLFKLLYLLAARDNEICTKVTTADKTTRPFGKHLSWTFAKFQTPKDTLLVKVPILKRKNTKPDKPKFRFVALPISPSIEPWTADILKWMVKNGTELGLPITRQRVYQLLRENLYPAFGIEPNPKEHSKNILRHFRINHLLSEYDFDLMDLVSYSGWSIKTGGATMGFPTGQLDIYLHLKWKRYAAKLFRPLGEVLGSFLA